MRVLTTVVASAATIFGMLQPAVAEDLTAAEMAKRLAPKAALTRSLSSKSTMNDGDAALIDRLSGLTRSITVEERTALAPVVANGELPQLDLTVEFDFNSAEITPEATVTLVKLGTALGASELADSVFVFAGHTDSKGTAEYNQALSEQRALAVKNFVVQAFGIDARRVIAAGFGEEQPANSADTEAAENRRVSIVNVGH